MTQEVKHTAVHRIVRRAYSKYKTVVENAGGLVEAYLLAMQMESENKDGEYLVRSDSQPDELPAVHPQDQGAWAWL